MSASDPDSKIDLLDTREAVGKKLKKAVCVPRQVEGNGVIAFVEHVIFRAMALKTGQKARFVVEKREGEPLVYESVEKLKEDYEADIVRLLFLSLSLFRLYVLMRKSSRPNSSNQPSLPP
jgi:tyrosyl-tRNA synthetase